MKIYLYVSSVLGYPGWEGTCEEEKQVLRKLKTQGKGPILFYHNFSFKRYVIQFVPPHSA